MHAVNERAAGALPAVDLSSVHARPERMLLALIAWHLTFWVLAPILCYRMLPLDTLELLGWGQEWQWGYYKHPPLGAWLGEIALQLSGGHPYGLYVLAQSCVVVTLIYVWRTARMFLPPHAAVIAAVLLEGGYFYTYLTPNFNMNTLQLPTWAALAYHFLQAMRGRDRDWLYWGVCVALVMLTKYSGVLLIATCGLLLIATPAGRAALHRPGPWLGGAIAALLLMPHAAWLIEHGELPLRYLRSFDHSEAVPAYMHVVEPLRFAAAGVLGLLLSLLLFVPVYDRRGERLLQVRGDALLLVALCAGPLLLTMLYGAATGSRLKSTWAFPFFNLAGIVLFMLPTRLDRHRIARFAIALAAVALITAAGHVAYKTASDRSKTAFDGPALGAAISAAWSQRFDTPLAIVAGDHVTTAIVSTYAPSRPSMLVGGDLALSLWLTADDLARDGFAVVCAAGNACYPQLRPDGASLQQLRIGSQTFDYYFVPPAGRATR